MRLYDQTSADVAKLDRATIVLIPFGAVEQHSYHLPLGTDSILVQAIAERLERQLPDCILLLPTCWLGCSKHHMDFCGSLTAESETFIEYGCEIVNSMAEHGF